MKKTIKHLLVIGMPAAVILGFTLAGFIRKPADYSMSERRVLAQKPVLSAEQLASGKYMSEFETYSQDQFPLRDGFRTTKAITARYLLGQKDNHALYLSQGYISSLEYPMNEARVQGSVDVLNAIYDRFLAGTDCQLYLSVIPDKNCFVSQTGNYLSMDYPAFIQTVRDGIPAASYIDITDTIALESFYRTDQHWRQETIIETARRLAEGMHADFTADFTQQELDVPFYGTYYGQAALPVKPDTLYYLTNAELDQCQVTSYNTGKPRESYVYDMEKAHGRDPYELFLAGSDALLVVENPNAATDKELVLFRDSFGSSITPLLVHGYRKITLVDLRYIRSEMIGAFVQFDDQDVLFLYSTLILNNTISQ